MLKELKIEDIIELKDKVNKESELYDTLKLYANAISTGEKLKVKEKITKVYHSIVFYKYDKDLYRYIVSGEFFID